MLLFQIATTIFLIFNIASAVAFPRIVSFDLGRRYLEAGLQMNILTLIFLVQCVSLLKMINTGFDWFTVLRFIIIGISIIKINSVLVEESNNIHNEVSEEIGIK